MAWGHAFIERLQAESVQLVFSVEVFRSALDEGVGGSVGTWTTVDAGTGSPTLLGQTAAVGSQDLTPVTWSYGAAPWSFRLATPKANEIEKVLRRGTLVRMRAGFRDWDYSAWEIVQSGKVQSVRRSSHSSVDVEVWDLITSLDQRITGVFAEAFLFYDALNASPLTADYTAGDATITVIDATKFSRRTGGTGVVSMSPGGTLFYLAYTGSTATQLTGVSATGQFGTTAADLASGGNVENVAYLDQRPDQILARVLTSTGAGTNGSYDVLPKAWGYALTAFEAVDTSDMVSTWGNALLVPSSGTYSWGMISGLHESGISWLLSMFSAVGIWLCQRQGQITMRIVQDPNTATVHTGLEITDDDIVDGYVDWHLSTMPAPYAGLRQTSASLVSQEASDAATTALPVANIFDVDASDRLRSNETAVLQLTENYLIPWLARVAEAPTMTLRGLAWARLTVGDIVYLTSDRLRGRLLSTAEGYQRRSAMVLSVSPGWVQATTGITLGVLPVDDADEWST